MMAGACDVVFPGDTYVDRDDDCGSLPTTISLLLHDDESLSDASFSDSQKGDFSIEQQDTNLHETTEDNAVIEINFCKSVRNNVDTTNFVPPNYKERLIGVCNMIENGGGRYLTIDKIIAHIAEFKVYKRKNFPIKVTVKLKELDEIPKQDFVDCYRRMKELYDIEMRKEKTSRNPQSFKDYFEGLIETWALLDMTLVVLVNEGTGHPGITITQLLLFAFTRLGLVCAIERLLFNHFTFSTGARVLKCCVRNGAPFVIEETEGLDGYRTQIQDRVTNEYADPTNEKHSLSANYAKHELLLQLLSVQKRGRDTSKSESRKRRKSLSLFEQSDVAYGISCPQQQLQLRQQGCYSEHDEGDEGDDYDNGVIENDGLLETVKAFLNPVLIARLKNEMLDDDIMEWDQAFQQKNDEYDRKKRATSDEDENMEETVVDTPTLLKTVKSFLNPALIASLKNQMTEEDIARWNMSFQLENETCQSKKVALV